MSSSLEHYSETWLCQCGEYQEIQYVNDGGVVDPVVEQKCKFCGRKFEDDIWTYVNETDKKFSILLHKEPTFRVGSGGRIDINDFDFVATVYATDLDEVYKYTQNDYMSWAHRGNVRLTDKGLELGGLRSLSVGDVIVEGGEKMWVVDSVGFKAVS